MAAVMTMMGRASDWATAKKALGEGNFLTQVRMRPFQTYVSGERSGAQVEHEI